MEDIPDNAIVVMDKPRVIVKNTDTGETKNGKSN